MLHETAGNFRIGGVGAGPDLDRRHDRWVTDRSCTSAVCAVALFWGGREQPLDSIIWLP